MEAQLVGGFDMHCKALGGKIMIPGRLAWEKVTYLVAKVDL